MQNENIETIAEEEVTPEIGNQSESHPIVHDGQVRGTRYGNPIEVGVSTNQTFF